MIAISESLYEDCLAALQHMEDNHPSKRWTRVHKELVLALCQHIERDLSQDTPMLLRPQAG